MSINRIDIQGAIARTPEVSTIKQNEDNKGALNQVAFQEQFNRTTDEKLNRVGETMDTQRQQYKFDAKEKGSNEFFDERKKKQKKKEERQESGIFDKNGNKINDADSTFDFKI